MINGSPKWKLFMARSNIWKLEKCKILFQIFFLKRKILWAKFGTSSWRSVVIGSLSTSPIPSTYVGWKPERYWFVCRVPRASKPDNAFLTRLNYSWFLLAWRLLLVMDTGLLISSVKKPPALAVDVCA